MNVLSKYRISDNTTLQNFWQNNYFEFLTIPPLQISDKPIFLCLTIPPFLICETTPTTAYVTPRSLYLRDIPHYTNTSDQDCYLEILGLCYIYKALIEGKYRNESPTVENIVLYTKSSSRVHPKCMVTTVIAYFVWFICKAVKYSSVLHGSLQKLVITIT